MAHPPLMGWDRAAFEAMRSRLHDRHDEGLKPAFFTIRAWRHATGRGLTRTVAVDVTPPTEPFTAYSQDHDTRTWTGSVLPHRALGQMELEISAILEPYAADDAVPSAD